MDEPYLSHVNHWGYNPQKRAVGSSPPSKLSNDRHGGCSLIYFGNQVSSWSNGPNKWPISDSPIFQSCKKLFTIPFTLQIHPNTISSQTKKHTHQQVNKCQNICCSKKHTFANMFSCVSHLFGGFPMISQVFPWFSQVFLWFSQVFPWFSQVFPWLPHDFPMTFDWSLIHFEGSEGRGQQLDLWGVTTFHVTASLGKNRSGVSYGEFLWWISME